MNPPETPVQRLARSRTQLVQWLDHDQGRRETFSHTGLGQFTAIPWIRRIADHPLASLAMGAFTKWWMKPRAKRSSTATAVALGTGLGLLRRRPVLTLGTVSAIGAWVWWTQLRRRPVAALNAPSR
ncbi:MAG: hypothetical protein QUV35_12335 [Hydrogenophaga sp.]|uniref:hypothetical protein n=1 Tax=Hydrogenophaga sp. TaxID=1904254 RepID=UPI0026065A91|nr:hypothetical protein [Hydrogenophaga sp.]MDM7943408.1 hypothetical protein [Hydrogenophaga sp.]